MEPNPTKVDFDLIYEKRALSYRYYNHLSDTQKAYLDSKKLLPKLNLYAMQIRVVYQISIIKAVKLALSTIEDYQEWKLTRQYNLLRHIENNMDYVEKEFLFQGFVPVSEFKVHHHYSYIMSNRNIKGVTYIYPMEFSNNLKTITEEKPYIIPYFSLIGVEGYTKLKE